MNVDTNKLRKQLEQAVEDYGQHPYYRDSVIDIDEMIDETVDFTTDFHLIGSDGGWDRFDERIGYITDGLLDGSMVYGTSIED